MTVNEKLLYFLTDLWSQSEFRTQRKSQWKNGTVCRQQSLLRQPCIHSVEPCSPHLSHHLSDIRLSALWANVTFLWLC